MQEVFAASLTSRLWYEAATALIFLRWLNSTEPPVNRVLHPLLDPLPDDDMSVYLSDLERIPNHSVQIAIAVLVAARWYDLGCSAAVEALFGWLNQRQVNLVSGHTPAAQALDAVLLAAPVELTEQLFSLSVFENTNQQFGVLATLWGRAPQGTLRHTLRERLEQDRGALHPEHETVEGIACQATDIGDAELCLAALQWLGDSPAEVMVERLPLTELADRFENLIPQAVQLLCGNPRLQRYSSIRAAVCALVLMGQKLSVEVSVSELAEELAGAANVDLSEVRLALAANCAMAGELWAASPAAFFQWLSRRIPFLIQDSIDLAEGTPHLEQVDAALRTFVSHMCTVLRWVAAQSNNFPEDQAAVQASLETLSRLAWKAFHPDPPPYLDEKGKRDCPLEALDPLRASACLRTANWLAEGGWLPSPRRFSSIKEEEAAAREIVHQVFASASDEAMDLLESAFAAAWGAPAPRLETDLSTSPWLAVYEAIALSIDVFWQPAWSTGLKHHDFRSFPERLNSYFKQLRDRVIALSYEQGWCPQLLELGVNIARLLGEDQLDDEELTSLVVPGLAAMDTDALRDCPNNASWPSPVLPVLLAARIPEPFASAVATMELNDRGVLWGICEHLCRPAQKTEWWDSVKQFRDSLRRIITDSPPRQLWYKADEPSEHLLEAALAPINLIVDEPPQKSDFEQLKKEVNFDPDSCHVRLKACIHSYPRPEMLQWAVETVASMKPKYALWLLKHLIKARRWDLLHDLLERLYGHTGKQLDYLAGFEILQEPPLSVETKPLHWSKHLANIFGMGHNENLIYQVPKLARQRLAGTLFENKEFMEQKKAIHLATDWPTKVRKLFEHPDTHKVELVRMLLVVALLTGNDQPAYISENLIQQNDSDLEEKMATELLWVGYTIAPDLIREERLEILATSCTDAYNLTNLEGDGSDALHILALLKRWDLIRRNLKAFAEFEPKSKSEYPLLQWYMGCSSFNLDDQLAYLQIYCESAPELLAAQHHSSALTRPPAAALRPTSPVSKTLKYSSYSLPKPIVKASIAGRPDVAQAWFQAVLIEAAYGPDRKEDIDSLETVCACAGAALVKNGDDGLWTQWIDFVQELSDKFETRSFWRAFFRGIVVSQKQELAAELYERIVRSDSSALLAMGEILADYGDPNDARNLLDDLVWTSRYPWIIALRACEAFLFRNVPSTPQHESLAHDFVALAWEKAQEVTDLRDPEFLATVAERAVQVRCEPVLEAIAETCGQDLTTAAVIGRIVLDVFLSEVKRERTRAQGRTPFWVLTDVMDHEALKRLVFNLVEEASSSTSRSYNMSHYNHDWSDQNIASEIGWLGALMKQILADQAPHELLAWVATWIVRISPERDTKAQVCTPLSSWLDKAASVPVVEHALVDFALESLKSFQGDLSDFINRMEGLLKARYRWEECLEIVDDRLKCNPHDRQWALQQVLTTCSQQNPESHVAERYLEQLTTDRRALVKNEIAKTLNVPAVERLLPLCTAPQTPEVVEQVLRLLENMISDMERLDDVALEMMSSTLARLLSRTNRLETLVAKKLGNLVQPSAHASLREDSQLLCHLKS